MVFLRGPSGGRKRTTDQREDQVPKFRAALAAKCATPSRLCHPRLSPPPLPPLLPQSPRQADRRPRRSAVGGRVQRVAGARGRAGPQAEEPMRRPPQAGEGAALARRGPRGLPMLQPPAPLRAPAKKSKSKPQKEATEHIVENGSESRSTRPRASLSWKSRTAWPCRRLPRRNSRRSARSRSRARHLVLTPRGAASWLLGGAKTRSPPGTSRRGRRTSRLNQLQTPQACRSVVCVRFACEGC